MDIFVLNATKMCKCDSMNYEEYILSFLYCCPDFVLSKKLLRCNICFVCMFEFLDHTKLDLYVA